VLGLVATTHPGGAGKWKHEFAETVRGRKVVVVADRDFAGMKDARIRMESLREVAGELHIEPCSWLGGGNIHDISDYVQAMRDACFEDDDIRQWLIPGTRPSAYDRDPLDFWRQEAGSIAPDPVEFVSLAPTEGERGRNQKWTPVPIITDGGADIRVEWVWGEGERGFVASGEITDLYGLWKSGKSTLIAALLASRGRTLADKPVAPVPVLLITEESARRWARRANALSISPDEVHRISRPFKKRPEWQEWQEFVTHVERLIKGRGYRLVIVDALPNLWPVVKENDAGEVLRALQPLQTWAEASAAVLLVRHPRKSDGSEATAGRGSGAIGGFVDIICEFRRYRPQDDKDKRRILTVYSREEPFEIVVEWEGGAEYVEMGSKAEVGRRERVEAVRELLLSHPDLTEDEAHAHWDNPDIPKPRRTTYGEWLRQAVKDGAVGRTGEGKRGDPFRYSGIPLEHQEPGSPPEHGEENASQNPRIRFWRAVPP
jgi:AAA domain